MVNKRGLMLNFLTSLLIAIFLFGTAFGIVSKVFRTSSQAKESFIEFLEDIEDFSNGGKELDSSLLIMDEESLVILFKNKERKLILSQSKADFDASVTSSFLAPDPEEIKKRIDWKYNFYFSYPANYCTKEECACLCDSFRIGQAKSYNTDIKNELIELSVPCKNLFCRELDVSLEETWSIDRQKKDNNIFRRSLIEFTKNSKGEIILEQK